VKRSLLVAAGIAAFLVALVAMVPASEVASRLPPGASLSGVGGTVWSGHARTLAIEGKPLGALDWSCSPWRLLALRWSCDVTLIPVGGEVNGRLDGDFGGGLVARGLRGQVPIALFEGFAGPRGWSGNLELDVDEVQFTDRRPSSARGTLFLRQLRAPGAQGRSLGDFELVVGEGAVGGEALSGRLRDLGGPLRVRGAIELKADGSYLLRGDVSPGPGAGPRDFDALSFLGPPDSQGRRSFTIEGSL
jgi:general secretion pathway protein N